MLHILPACSSRTEDPTGKAQKVKKFTPENEVITGESLEKWLLATERVGEFIRKFALEDEEIRNKDEFMFLAHSSQRTEAILTSLFKSMDLKQGEFWWIMDRLTDSGKYVELKTQEESQNRRINIILSAGLEEKAATEKALAKEMTEAGKKELNRRLDIIDAKFSELSSLKGHTAPGQMGIKPENVDLYIKNKDRIEAAVKKMWKLKPGGKEEISRDKSIPGH